MRPGFVAFVALTLVGLGLTGCGLFRGEEREPWRAQAEQACLSQKLVQPSAYMSRASAIEGPGACGMDYPFKVAAFSGGSVGLTSKATLACPIISTIDRWLEEVVKPASLIYFGEPVVDMRAGSYSCRPRNNQRGAKYSEHAFGNAFDVMGFTLASGREITVVKGWRGNQVEGDFLREVFTGACGYFTTVLAPGSDAFHYDHIHIDLARHDPRGERQICKPAIKFVSRLTETRFAKAPRKPVEVAAIDMERDTPVEMPFARQTPRPAPASVAAPSAPSPALPPALPRVGGLPGPPPGPVYATAQAYRPQPPGPPPLALPSDPYRPLGSYTRPPQMLNGHGIY
jgi:hypothetical protein